jgi:mono/diheme cytochrome c family protein
MKSATFRGYLAVVKTENPTTRSVLGCSLAILLIGSAASLRAEPETVLRWNFDDAEEAGEWQGKVGKGDGSVEGPRPPRYPGFDPGNEAGRFEHGNAFLVVKDEERGGPANLRFGLGETLAIEAWIKVRDLKNGEMAYLLGKGRHGKLGADLGENNQNYAVRLKGTGGGAEVGFLFTSIDPANGGKREWHRWWSKATVPTTGWHHLAVVYTFGKKDSLRVLVDGKATDGIWDMGGATDLGPVTDADDLVVGTGSKRSAGESFDGWIDGLAIYRGAPDLAELGSRYTFVPPPPPVTREMVPAGQILVQISEKGVPEANSWPEEPEVTEIYREEVFGFFGWPQKYISTGVRADRANPSHFRASALVKLPPGKHRLLIRSRGPAKLHIDGELVLENPFPKPDTGGHGLLSEQDDYLDLGPDFRFAPPGNREAWCEFETKGGEHFVILETMVGGVAGKAKRRPEFGETVAAISPEGSESWQLLAPGARAVPYTDEGWAAYEAERRDWLDRVDAESRAARRAEGAAYWASRREAARRWLASVEPVVVPELPEGYPAFNAIDHFLADRIARTKAVAEASREGSVDYFKQIQPLLEARCYSCHQGGKAKGGLRLDQHTAALEGGKSDGPAVVPGDAAGSSLLQRILPDAGEDIMPPKGDPLSEAEAALLARWIEEGAAWPQFDVARFEPTPLAEDLAFLRRAHLDTVGVPPTEAEIARFLGEPERERRALVIDRLLDDPRWADRWMGVWQDALAENPNIINPTLNNTGPFRWWLYESLLDNKPADLFATELLRMEGSERFGGPAGFATASQNDVPMAAKGMIVSSTFLGVEMKCARCHDAPAHRSKQEDLFQLAAMMQKSSIKLPESSSVPMDRIHQTGRAPLIEVTLMPGAEVVPAWPFPEFAKEESAAALAERPEDPRDRLAALVTAPENQRFAQVMVNRVWEQLMGRGIVESVGDWEKTAPSHPELLEWLGHELVRKEYNLKAIARLILGSHAYQRAVDPLLAAPSPLFVSPAPRRLSAEQIVDSLFAATGAPFELEEVSLDLDSVRVFSNSITLGKPRRAWMLASTSNERDRPSLSLPRIQAVASLMETFGWRGSRQDPIHEREAEPNVLQPAILANGTMGLWLTRLSDRHAVTALALEAASPEELVERLYLRLLTREPSAHERERYVSLLAEGFGGRLVPEAQRPVERSGKREPVRYVSWSNHLDGPANTLATENEEQARRGDPPTSALAEDWRLRLEDVLWAMLNSPEWIYAP